LGVATAVGIAAVAALTFALFHETRSTATQTADRLDKGSKETAAKLDKQAVEMAELRKAVADVAAAVSPKPLAAGQTQPDPIPPEILAKARLLLERGDDEQRALGMIALKQHAAADRLIQQLKSKPGNPLDEACRLLTLEGDNWYQANQPGKAVGPYEQAFALKPKDFQARNKLTIALISARLGNTAARCGRAIDISEQTLRLVPPGSTNWARTQNNLGVAWRDLPTGDKAENVKKAIAAYEAALAVYTKDADPVDWARVHCDLGLAWARNPAGDKAENRKKAIVAFEAALTVYSAGAPTRPRLGAEITLSWVRLLAKDFAGALATASRAAEDGNVNLPLEANHAHALLLLGRADEAEAMYFNHVGERIGEKTWEQVVLQDFDRLEKNGIVSPEFARLRELLKQAAEMKQLSGEPAAATRAGP
jgi:tetratricopeptide (TPR) repeat protein